MDIRRHYPDIRDLHKEVEDLAEYMSIQFNELEGITEFYGLSINPVVILLALGMILQQAFDPAPEVKAESVKRWQRVHAAISILKSNAGTLIGAPPGTATQIHFITDDYPNRIYDTVVRLKTEPEFEGLLARMIERYRLRYLN